MTSCTPSCCSNAPILGAGTSITELFRLAGASGTSGSLGLIGYDWEYFRPIRKEIDHRVEGPVHWDRQANARLGIPGRVVNQGPLNLGYVANMLMAWAGPASIRRFTVSFGPPVLDGDHVVAHGRVRDVIDGVSHCDGWLDRDGEPVVIGTAEVLAPPSAGPRLNYCG